MSISNYNRDEVAAKVFQAVAEASGSDVSELSNDTELITSLDMDSLAIFELVIELEEAFSLRIPDEDIDDIRTIAEAVNYICKKVE